MIGKTTHQPTPEAALDERALALHDLRASADLMEQYGRGFCVSDPADDTFVLMNATFALMHGYTREELVGKHISIVKAPERVAELQVSLRNTDEKGRYAFDSVQQRKDGTTFPVHIDICTVQDAEGNVLFRGAQIEDISDRKRAEQAAILLRTVTVLLREAEDFTSALSVVLAQVCEGLGWDYGDAWVPNPSSELLECSPAWYARTPAAEQFNQENARRPCEFNRGLPGRVWASNVPEWIEDLSTTDSLISYRSEAAASAGLRSALAVPISIGGEVLTVLVFFQRAADPANRQETDIITAIAAQLGSLLKWMRTKESLRESEETNRALLHANPDMMFRMGRDGTYLEFLPGESINPHVSPEEFVGKSVADIMPSDLAGKTLEFIERALQSGVTQSFEYDLDTGAETRNYEARFAAAGENEVLAIVRDITERKRTEAALRDSEEKYRTLFETGTDAFITALPGGLIVDANDAASAMLGYTHDELLQLAGPEIIAPDVFEETEEDWRVQLEAKGQFTTDTVWVRKDGTRLPVSVSGKPIELGGQQFFQLIGRDISDRISTEEARRDAVDALEGTVETAILRKNPYGLTFREYTVLQLVANGSPDKMIAAELSISPLTVHKHVGNILSKMDATSRTEAGVRAQREGLLS